MPQSLSNTIIHIVFSTKHRKKLIDSEIESRIFGCLGNICNENKCQTIIVGGYQDHVHILCHLHRTISISQLVKEIKINSSKWIKSVDEKYKNFYWQDGYGVFSVSQSGVSKVVDYIKNQKEHHNKKTFKAEYKAFLDKNDVSYDDNYMWD